MKRTIQIAVITVLCALAGLAISSCKKKGPKTASAEIAVDASDLRKQVEKTIKNKIRRGHVLMLVDDIDRTREEVMLLFLNLQKKVHKDPSMVREDYDAVLQEFAVARVNSLRKIASARITMRTYVTEAEWRELFSKKKTTGDSDKGAEQTDHKAPESEDAPEQPKGDAAETKTPDGESEEAGNEVSP
jgi:hypothetical protein